MARAKQNPRKKTQSPTDAMGPPSVAHLDGAQEKQNN
jgi:hypothetical protein